ncbi:hypothetical protein HMPREF1871_01109 [Gemelliphila asaccharolytica]|uniref:NADH dehydrogenase subunit 4L n=1 Tax=Gemelliphila asaccharolytica TaxID=502393 RepID=A0ABR5TKT1_9BACL|nr:hypothetical protein HMPREF1871_01109 [Gemella asaccharolytica]
MFFCFFLIILFYHVNCCFSIFIGNLLFFVSRGAFFIAICLL